MTHHRYIFHTDLFFVWMVVVLPLLLFSCTDNTTAVDPCETNLSSFISTPVDSLTGIHIGTHSFREIRSYSNDVVQITPDQVLSITPSESSTIQVNFLNTITDLCFSFEDSDSIIFTYAESDYCCSTLESQLTIYKISEKVRYRHYRTYTASGHFSATENLFYD